MLFVAMSSMCRQVKQRGVLPYIVVINVLAAPGLARKILTIKTRYNEYVRIVDKSLRLIQARLELVEQNTVLENVQAKHEEWRELKYHVKIAANYSK